tara:strand:+ start:357 stop:755 length:399 start_codon:yes stop_codon:yes gene_type:complete
MPDPVGRKLLSDMQQAQSRMGMNTPAGRTQGKAVERTAKALNKQAASKYVRANNASRAAQAAKTAANVAKLTKVSPVGIVAGVALEKGSEFARKKFVEADMRKISKINKRNQALDQHMDSLRKKNQGRINIK